MIRTIVAFWADEDGQDLVEYSLLLALIVLAVVALFGGVKTSVSNILIRTNASLSSAAASSS